MTSIISRIAMENTPIPAFYCCYLLRSANRTTLYVGSTPNMRRRLKQHNGDAVGGAKRTSNLAWKPWEVTCIVQGFPSRMAALQFEWSWQNPHITRHISAQERITHPKKTEWISPRSERTRTRTRRPVISLNSYMMNLHLLLRVQSFSRWPLSLRFFVTDVFRVWQTNDKKANQSLRSSIQVTLDPMAIDTIVKRKKVSKVDDSNSLSKPASKDQGKSDSKDEKAHNLKESEAVQVTSKTAPAIGNLDFGYSAVKPHLEKSRSLLSAGRKATCSCCNGKIKEDPLVVVCPHSDCSAVSHIQCLSTHFLWREHGKSGDLPITPIEGTCPSCNTTTKWEILVQELTLRMRGQKEVDQLFNAPRKKKADANVESDDDVDPNEDEDVSRFLEFEEEEIMILEELDSQADANSLTKAHISPSKHSNHKQNLLKDSDWTGVEVLD